MLQLGERKHGREGEHPHRLDGGERLGGVVPNVLGEEHLPVKVEP